MIWTRVNDALPPAGKRVLAFGRDLPDGRWQKRLEYIAFAHHGISYWSVSDEVSHWCAIEDVPEPGDA